MKVTVSPLSSACGWEGVVERERRVGGVRTMRPSVFRIGRAAPLPCSPPRGRHRSRPPHNPPRHRHQARDRAVNIPSGASQARQARHRGGVGGRRRHTHTRPRPRPLRRAFSFFFFSSCLPSRSSSHLHRDDVLVARALQHLGHVGQVDAHGQVAVAPEVVEAVGAQLHRDERDVRRVHRLQREPRRGAVKVGVRDQVLDRLQQLLEQDALGEAGLKHGEEEGGGCGGVRVEGEKLRE